MPLVFTENEATGSGIKYADHTGISHNSMVGAGAAYVFGKNNGLWTQRAYVKASNTAPVAYFGQALALSVNAGTLAVGSYTESGNSHGINGPQVTQPLPESGAVYVY